jgi:hypothetical protein
VSTLVTTLIVRRLKIDLDAPVARHWCGGDAFRTAFFNALSMSFPAGEQVFIDSVRRGVAALPDTISAPERARFEGEVQAFVGQEATHRHIHARFNALIAAHGLVNHWEPRILERRERVMAQLDTRNWVAVTAATEHWTAILAQHLLAQGWLLEGAEPRLRELWQWHSAEELEHRSTAFDLYRALGGSHVWRVRIFKVVSWHFVTDVLRQTAHNLWRDGTWWRPSTWASAWRVLFGRQGLARLGWAPWKRYLAADFHPAEGDGAAGERWLAEHRELAPPVRAQGA